MLKSYVYSFITCILAFKVEVERTYLNTNINNLGFMPTYVFQHIIKLWNQKFFFCLLLQSKLQIEVPSALTTTSAIRKIYLNLKVF
jgi:hypothetical protein